MKLEAVNPLSPEHIHVATVTKVKGQHMWLSLEGEYFVEPFMLKLLQINFMDTYPSFFLSVQGLSSQCPS